MNFTSMTFFFIIILLGMLIASIAFTRYGYRRFVSAKLNFKEDLKKQSLDVLDQEDLAVLLYNSKMSYQHAKSDFAVNTVILCLVLISALVMTIKSIS